MMFTLLHVSVQAWLSVLMGPRLQISSVYIIYVIASNSNVINILCDVDKLLSSWTIAAYGNVPVGLSIWVQNVVRLEWTSGKNIF